MKRPPVHRRSPALLIIPFLVIAGALALGAFLNRGKANEVGGEEAPYGALKPGTGVVIGKIASGFTPPLNGKGKPIFSKLGLDSASPVAWGSIELVGSDENIHVFNQYISRTFHDETGHSWPLISTVDGKTLYFGIARGYSSTAKEVTVTLKAEGKKIAQVEIPVPKPSPLTPPPLTPPWKGLIAEVCYPYGINSNPLFYIDAPIEKGHILAAAISGTTYSRERTDYFHIVKGPDAGPYDQITTFPLLYPDAKGKAYLNVVEFAPAHIQRRLRFKNFTSADKFGSPWIMGPSSVEKFSDGVFFRLSGNDKFPFHAPDHVRRIIVLWLDGSGPVRHVVATLISPTSARSIPFHVRHDASAIEKVTAAVPGVDWKSGQLEFVVDVEGDVYHEIRHATIAVDRSSPGVRHLHADSLPSVITIPNKNKFYFPFRG